MNLKTPIYRNKKLTDLAKDAPCCFACDRYNDGTIVPAHNNEIRFGKGRGIKNSDALTAFVCGLCHHQIDEGKLPREEKQRMWTEAYIRTMKWLLESGHLRVA